MSTGGRKITSYKANRLELFDFYRRFRYGEIVAYGLMNAASRIEKYVRNSVLGLVGISLLTGSTSYLNPPVLAPVWSVISALATLLAVMALAVGSGAKQFAWFSLAGKFRTAAAEMEFFSHYVKLGKITEDELLKTWNAFSNKLAELLHHGGLEHRQYEEKNRNKLLEELKATLKSEKKIA